MFLQEIKKAFPNTQFLVFTTPVALPHLQMIEEENILPQYKQWLRDITDVFGEVWHFMDKNTISQDYTLYFSDSHHLYPEETNLLVQRMLNKNGEQVPADFGKKLTTVNIDAYLEKLSFWIWFLRNELDKNRPVRIKSVRDGSLHKHSTLNYS